MIRTRSFRLMKSTNQRHISSMIPTIHVEDHITLFIRIKGLFASLFHQDLLEQALTLHVILPPSIEDPQETDTPLIQEGMLHSAWFVDHSITGQMNVLRRLQAPSDMEYNLMLPDTLKQKARTLKVHTIAAHLMNIQLCTDPQMCNMTIKKCRYLG